MNLIITTDEQMKKIDLDTFDWKLLYNLDSVTTQEDLQDLIEQITMFLDNLKKEQREHE